MRVTFLCAWLNLALAVMPYLCLPFAPLCPQVSMVWALWLGCITARTRKWTAHTRQAGTGAGTKWLGAETGSGDSSSPDLNKTAGLRVYRRVQPPTTTPPWHPCLMMLRLLTQALPVGCDFVVPARPLLCCASTFGCSGYFQVGHVASSFVTSGELTHHRASTGTGIQRMISNKYFQRFVQRTGSYCNHHAQIH